ncbi:unnamed protein product, partial [Chrysoparadoxa australica]
MLLHAVEALGPCAYLAHHEAAINPATLRRLDIGAYDQVTLACEDEKAVHAHCRVVPDDDVGMDELFLTGYLLSALQGAPHQGLSLRIDCFKTSMGGSAAKVTLECLQLAWLRFPKGLNHVNALRRRLHGEALSKGCLITAGSLCETQAYRVISVQGADVEASNVVNQRTVLTIQEAVCAAPPAVEVREAGIRAVGLEKLRDDLVELVMLASTDQAGVIPLPHGILLHGPSGVGKTALLDELEASLMNYDMATTRVDGAEVASAAGVGPREMENLEDRAVKVLLLDHLESLAGNEAMELKLASRRLAGVVQDLWDANVSLVVVGAASRKHLTGSLEKLFDRSLAIGTPSAPTRAEILRHLDPSVTLDRALKLSDMTPGMNGGDLMRLVRLRRSLSLPDGSAALQDPFSSWEQAVSQITPSVLNGCGITKGSRSSWDDVGGYEGPRRQLLQLVLWPLMYKETFKRMGKHHVSGVVLEGPSGCGKTLLAGALARECGANFITVRATDLFSQYLGEAEARLRKLFEDARAAAPAVLFFDELDAFTTTREASSGDAASSVYLRILSTLLNEMDGITSSGTRGGGILLLGATNRVEALDSALLRPGRLSGRVHVGIPGATDRSAVFQVHTMRMPLEAGVDLEALAADDKTGGMTCAEVAAVCKKAGLLALHDCREAHAVKREHFMAAIG